MNRLDPFHALLALYAGGILCLLAAMQVAMTMNWQPGEQETIYRAFKTQQAERMASR